MTLLAILYTDVVDSTRLGERMGDARAAQIWSAHDRHARDLVARHYGREIGRADGIFAGFEDPVDAARYALDYHRELARLALQARVGIHVGPVTFRENPPEHVAHGAMNTEVDGLAIALAARVMSLARGGQTLLSAAAREPLAGNLPEGACLECHGYFRLKGIEEPVEIFELGVRDASPFLPPADVDKAYRVVRDGESWRPVREVRHNLLAERDAFVGRTMELRDLAAQLDSGTRLLTVLGPGGTGKTRLVRRYGRTWLGDWPGGVYFCDLSEAQSLDGIIFAVASALEVPLGKDDPAVQLGHAIASRGRCLVILDNFEQVVAHAPATVGRWLDFAPDAAFVVTSRERLNLLGEDAFPIEPLPLEEDAIDLFTTRARAQRPDFALTESNRAAVAEVVRLLDGLPLAIELAAARVRVLSPGQLVERMRDRFTLLAGARGAAARQATLRAAIDWSWNLLVAWEQAALAQCSVFEGGFTLDSAEAVLDLSSWAGAPSIVDAVQVLVDKSLLRTWVPVDQARHALVEPYFGMYLTIHEYAAEKLAASGPDGRRAAQERHGRHFARFGSDERLLTLRRHGGGARRRALTLELDNFVAACKRAVAQGDGATAVATLRVAWAAVATQGPFDLVIDLGMQVDGLQQIEPTLRAAALTVVGRATVATGRLDQAVPLFERALALARSANDATREAHVLIRLANAERQQGRMDEARRHAEQALALRGALGQVEGDALYELGIVQRQTGAMQEARATYERALAIDRELGNGDAEARVLNSLAILHAEQGRFDEARAGFESALSISRELGDRRQEGLVLGNLGSLNSEQGRLGIGRQQSEAALAIHRDTGERIEEGQALANIALLDQAAGRVEAARSNFFAALTIARGASNRRQEGVVLGCLGALESENGQLDEARLHYDQALAIHRAVGNRRSEGVVLAQLADLLARQGRDEEARGLLAQAEAHLRAVGETLDLAGLLCLRGRLELAAGEPERARRSLEEADSGARALDLDADSKVWKEIAALREAIGAGRSTAR